ncbi:MAG TPA: prolyl oligopeptidase family serine peptidase [Xanthomonadaceae bacterium]|nr:prolyl oligopeptidase family serine peptidase [Xanthomonadaceae bacterium]
MRNGCGGATASRAAWRSGNGRPAIRRPGWIGFVLLCLLLACALPCAAMVRVVDPGEIPRLDPDEGLLLVAVDSNNPLQSIRVKKGGTLFTAGVLRDIKEGRTARLYVVPAGRYAWYDVTPFWFARYPLKDRAEYHFDVAPGKITYAGDLVVRLTGWFSARLLVSNRGLSAMDWLEEQHPQLARSKEFVYSGHYPDPFPAFYRKERAASTANTAELAAVAEPPAAGPLPLAVRDLWRPDYVDWVSLNPAGDLMVEALRLDEKQWALDLVDLKTHVARRLATSPMRFVALDWAGDRLALAGVGEDEGRQVVTLFRIVDDAQGGREIFSQRIPASGHVLATSYGVPGQILFESYMDDERVLVHPLDVSRGDAVKHFRPQLRGRLNKGVDDDLGWYADGHGRLRAAIARRGEKGDERIALMWGGAGAPFQQVLEFDGDEGAFRPQALSYDGDLIYGLSDENRAQRELVEFDPVQRKVTRTLFAKPGVDVLAPLLDERRRPIGALYFESGKVVTEYFDAGRQRFAGLLAQAFPGRTVTATGRSRDGRQLLVWVQASDQPAQLYHVDAVRGQAALLEVAAPWLEGKRFVASTLLQVESSDGLPIEAYLTVPPGQGPRPLVVLPHGGPVGVSDNLLFNPEVQFLASLGYAVLQVNYRGSDGYGKAFRQAGYGQWGTRIEDDIDAAVQAALARYPLDPQRMCVMGASYGGYSALESVLRWPGRFRCAVSIAGVSDRALFFSASDFGQRARLREHAERVIGSPLTDLDQMLATSPLYHYRDFQAPLMLVHGREDMRVDYEHSRRLVRMLNLAGRKPVMLSFDKEAHGLEDLDNLDKAYGGIAGFLRAHLGPAAVVAADAADGGTVAPAGKAAH